MTKSLVERVEEIRQRTLFDNDSVVMPDGVAPSQEELAVLHRHSEKNIEKSSNRSSLLPVRHLNRDFFLCDLFDYAIKDDGASMEAPIFTLSTKPDLTEWYWESKDGSRSVTVTPSVKGRATQFDKDVLIYIVSQITEALNRNRFDAKSLSVRFTVHDYLVATNKPTGGKEYQRLEEALDRLSGTRIKTNIKTGNQLIKAGFGLIDRWEIIERSPTDERAIATEVTLSKWLYNAVQAHEVLTISRDYFRLRKPLERRIYELARKHCGKQAMWSINIDLLREKSGSRSKLPGFKQKIKAIIEADALPDYRVAFDKKNENLVLFVTRDMNKLVTSMLKQNSKS